MAQVYCRKLKSTRRAVPVLLTFCGQKMNGK